LIFISRLPAAAIFRHECRYIASLHIFLYNFSETNRTATEGDKEKIKIRRRYHFFYRMQKEEI